MFHSVRNSIVRMVQYSSFVLIIVLLLFDSALANPNIVRFDPTFGNNGIAPSGGTAPQRDGLIRVQQDGKIIFVCAFADGITRIARYNVNGSLDTSFGSGFISFPADVGISDFIIDASGKIVLVGSSINPNAGNDFVYTVIRLNTNGTFDTTFNGNGIVKINRSINGQLSDILFEVAIQADGKILACGRTGTSIPEVMRLNPGGTLDTSFGQNGFVTLSQRVWRSFDFVGVMSDGKIITGGYSQMGPKGFGGSLASLNPDGSLNTSFGSAGIYDNINFSPSDVLIQPDNKIVVLGGQNYRLLFNGTLDSSFYGELGASSARRGVLFPDGRFATLEPGGQRIIIRTSNYVKIAEILLPSGYSNFYDLAVDPSSRLVTSINNVDLTQVFLARFLTAGIHSTAVADFDGDGRTDISVYRPSTGVWHLLESAQGYNAIQWGTATDLLAPADYDNDGKTDFAVFRPSNGTWYVFTSGGGILIVPFGQTGDTPLPGDFDGDGKADVAVFRPSNGVWYRRNSSDNQFVAVQFGQTGDIPLMADFDGDGKADLAVYRSSNGVWYRINSSNNQFSATQFGTAEDIPVAADYDGDGKTDIAVFRPSNGVWYRLNSSNNQFSAFQFGQSGDIPTVADYDVDGKADISVFRPQNGYWYSYGSRYYASFSTIQFGQNQDRPIPAAFLAQ